MKLGKLSNFLGGVNVKEHRVIIFKESQLKSYTPHGDKGLTLHIKIGQFDMHESSKAAGQSILDVLHSHINHRFALVLSHIGDDETTKKNPEKELTPEAAELRELVKLTRERRKELDYQEFIFENSPTILQRPERVIVTGDQTERRTLAAALQHHWCRVQSLDDIEPGTEAELRLKLLESAFDADLAGLDPAVALTLPDERT